MLVPSVSTVLGLAAALGSAVAATVPTEARQVEQLEDDGAFLITRAFLTKPASRPGSYKYCSIILNITDPTTQSTAWCEAEYGPCNRNSVDPPAEPRPLNDTKHAASCAPDAPGEDEEPFRFYFDEYGGIANYSVRVSRGGLTGSTGLINLDVYGGALRFQCGGSGFCTSVITIGVRAPFDTD